MPQPPASLRRPIGIVVAILAGVCVYAIRQADPDLFGYLAYGRLFASRGALSDVDPFAYTSAGSHWVAFEYLAQFSLWIIFARFGAIGLIGLKVVLGGAAVWFLWRSMRAVSDEAVIWAPVFLLCVSTISRFFVFRPQLFTFAAFSLFTLSLLRHLLGQRASLWALPVVMLVWVNVHGGFLAGLALLALAAGIQICINLNQNAAGPRSPFNRLVPLLFTSVACIVATLVNPHTTRLWRYVITEVGHDTNRRYIAEWQPLSWGRDPWSATALCFIGALVVCVGWVAQRQHRRVAGLPPWLWAATCAPLIVMACVSVRHVPLAAIWTGPVITLLASSLVEREPRRSLAVAWLAVSAVALIPIVLTVEYVVEHPSLTISTNGNVLGNQSPCRAVAFMQANHLAGNVYNPLWWGGYITWEAYPDLRVAMDGRNISLFPAALVEENLRFYSNDLTPEDQDVPLRYPTDFLLIPSNARVLERIHGDKRWRGMYADDDASLFVRADVIHEPLLALVARGALRAPRPCTATLTANAFQRNGVRGLGSSE